MRGDLGSAQWQHVQERYAVEFNKTLYDKTGFSEDDADMWKWIQRNVQWNP